MTSRRRIVLASFAALGLGAAAFMWISTRVSSRGAANVPYTLLSQVKDYCDDGRITDGGRELKFVDSKGDWRIKPLQPRGTFSDTVHQQGQGIAKLDRNGKKTELDSLATGHSADVEKLKKSDQYLRTVLILGYPTYLLKIKDRSGESMYVYHAPDLNGDVIMTSYRVGKCRRVVEPIAIWPGEPNQASVIGKLR
jgi:hypothetical protein